MDSLDRQLTAYYDREAERGLRTDLGPLRTSLRDETVDMLRRDGCMSLVDVGAGPGRDTAAFAECGFDVVGLELAPNNVRQLVGAGVPGVVASLYQPPFAPGSFDSVWSMSTLVHVPDEQLHVALAAITDLAKPGGPVVIGTWGGFDWEGESDFTEEMPPRFFALRTHEQHRAALAEHGEIERFDTYHPNPDNDWEYQFAVLRCD